MTTQTTGEQPIPTQPPQTPPPSPEDDVRSRLVAELAAQRAKDEQIAAEAPAEPAPTEAPALPPEQVEPSELDKRRAAVQERMLQRQQKYAEEQERQRTRTASEPPRQHQLDPWEEIARDPRGVAAALRARGIDPKRAIDELTNDMLAPGTVHATRTANDGVAEAKRAQQAVASLQEQWQAQQAYEAGQRENYAFAQHAETKTDKGAPIYPHLSALDPQARVEAALYVAGVLEQRGVPYDRENVAIETETWLSCIAPKPALASPPPTQPALPSQAAAPRSSPQAAAPPKTRSISPDMAGEGANPQPAPLTESQERAQMTAWLRKQARA